MHSGLGGTGSELALATKLYVMGKTTTQIIYVDSVTGINGASPAGYSRKRPLATLAQAMTNAGDNAIIVMMATHDETISTAVSTGFSEYLSIIGEGTDSAGRPSASLTIAEAVATSGITTSGSNVMFQNIRFKQPTAAMTKLTISLAGQGTIFDSCYFESGQYSDGALIKFAPSTCAGLRFKGCTFVSVSTNGAIASTPREVLSCGAVAGDMTVRMDDCVFDGGLTGYKEALNNPFCTDFHLSTGTVRFQGLGLSLLRGAILQLVDENTRWGFASTPTVTGGGGIMLLDSDGGGAAV